MVVPEHLISNHSISENTKDIFKSAKAVRFRFVAIVWTDGGTIWIRYNLPTNTLKRYSHTLANVIHEIKVISWRQFNLKAVPKRTAIEFVYITGKYMEMFYDVMLLAMEAFSAV